MIPDDSGHSTMPGEDLDYDAREALNALDMANGEANNHDVSPGEATPRTARSRSSLRRSARVVGDTEDEERDRDGEEVSAADELREALELEVEGEAAEVKAGEDVRTARMIVRSGGSNLRKKNKVFFDLSKLSLNVFLYFFSLSNLSIF